MGVYLNPGKTNYQMAINSEIFVDKSEMILFINSLINTNQRFVSVSRPRRFGKTMAADMLCAYYDREADSRSMFEKLKIAKSIESSEKDKWDKYLGQFDVIRIVLTDFMGGHKSVTDILKNLTYEVSEELMEDYSDIKINNTMNLHSILGKIYAKSKRQFVIIIDEWDAIFRVTQDDKEGQKEYLDFIRDLMKDKPYLSLAYMTGILPIKKYGKHSALNMFTEYSIMYPRKLAQFTGFTEKEVKEICYQYGRNFENVKDWYDGYNVNDVVPPDTGYQMLNETGNSPKAKKFEIYCPLSVVETMITGQIRNYWNKTETYEALAEYIRMDYDGLKEAVAILMDGGRVKIDTSTYQNDMVTFYGKDDIMSLLIHLGYLSFDDETSEVFIPNKEILDEFKTCVKINNLIGINYDKNIPNNDEDFKRHSCVIEKA